MQKVVVVYQSKYGSTKKYAQWIANSLNADIFETKKIKAEKLLNYDTIIYGGYLFATTIKGFDIIKKNIEQLKDKQIYVFCVGLSTPSEEVKKVVIEKNFADGLKDNAELFVLRGGMDYSKLNWIDKNMMKMMKKMLLKKKPEELTEDDKGLLSAYDMPVDFTDEKLIKPIIKSVQNA